MTLFRKFVGGSLLILGLNGCATRANNESEVLFTSNKAQLYKFEFSSEFLTDTNLKINNQIQEHLYYTIGQLNGKNSVGRLDGIENLQVNVEDAENRRFLVKYSVVLPVGWSNSNGTPKQFTFILPRDMTRSGKPKFVAKYKETCVDLWTAHDVSVDSMWYYYRPDLKSCKIDPAEFVRSDVKITLGTENTHNKYPEVHKVWEDKELRAIVIFGKDTAGATTVNDFGVGQYGRFNYLVKIWGAAEFDDIKLTPNIANLPEAPGAKDPHVTWNGTHVDGRKMQIDTFLIDNPQQTTSEFDTKYNELSKNADIIIYNGHAALGANVRAMARKGGVPNKGQYTIVSMMGCDSFAYVDGAMAQQRAAVNPDDPKGTKYLDMVTNIIPANPTWLPNAAMKLIGGVASLKHPQTYQQILQQFDRAQQAVITGDEDNTYVPGMN